MKRILPGIGLLLLVLPACTRAEPGATLAFGDENKPEVRTTTAALLAGIPAEEIRGYDPYYKREKRFRALPLRRVLEMGFPGRADLADQEFIFRAADGYAAYMRGARAMDDGAYLAVADLDNPGWEPIGPQRANPGPFYIVWKKPEQTDLETYPRPWQLAAIERTRFDVAYPHTKPSGDEPSALLGYALYRERCFKCHAVNREGGRVGPELNVPQNVLEYRPEAQVRAYIRNPATFRYGNMPPHPDLSETQMDQLIGYLRAMATRKYDPPAK